jgi:hypothetical protein
MMSLLQKNELKVFFKAGFFLTTASVIVGILGYIFQILVGRMLKPEDFAVFSALLALYILVGSPFAALNMLVTRRVSILRAAQRIKDEKHYYWTLQKWVLMAGLIVLLFFYFSADFFVEYFKAQSLPQLLIFSTLLIFSSLLVINNSFFQGLQLFGWQAISNIFSASIKFPSAESRGLNTVPPTQLLQIQILYAILRATPGKDCRRALNSRQPVLSRARKLRIPYKGLRWTMLSMVLRGTTRWMAGTVMTRSWAVLVKTSCREARVTTPL